MTRTLLIDADLLAYRTSAATQKSYQWDADTVSVAANMDDAIRFAEEEIVKIADRLKADDVVICLSDDFNSFRKKLVDPTYKEARSDVERPVNLYPMKAWLRENYTTAETPWLEADDVMGIIATDPARTDERIIVSADKDMMTIPGKLYRPQHQGGRVPRILNITPLEAIRFHFWQAIVGDTTDGYPGAYGVGPASPYAEDVLWAESEEEAWEEVLMAFASKGFTEADAVRQARLARILQFPDYRDGRVQLWLPPAYELEDD